MDVKISQQRAGEKLHRQIEHRMREHSENYQQAFSAVMVDPVNSELVAEYGAVCNAQSLEKDTKGSVRIPGANHWGKPEWTFGAASSEVHRRVKEKVGDHGVAPYRIALNAVLDDLAKSEPDLLEAYVRVV
jgi:hypothetical protein